MAEEWMPDVRRPHASGRDEARAPSIRTGGGAGTVRVAPGHKVAIASPRSIFHMKCMRRHRRFVHQGVLQEHANQACHQIDNAQRQNSMTCMSAPLYNVVDLASKIGGRCWLCLGLCSLLSILGYLVWMAKPRQLSGAMSQPKRTFGHLMP